MLIIFKMASQQKSRITKTDAVKLIKQFIDENSSDYTLEDSEDEYLPPQPDKESPKRYERLYYKIL